MCIRVKLWEDKVLALAHAATSFAGGVSRMHVSLKSTIHKALLAHDTRHVTPEPSV